jgi:hypothetical protein
MFPERLKCPRGAQEASTQQTQKHGTTEDDDDDRYVLSTEKDLVARTMYCV